MGEAGKRKPIDWRGGPMARVGVWGLCLIAVILTGAALKALTVVIVPVVAAFFVALTLHPMVAWVRGAVPARLAALGPLLAFLVMLTTIGIFGAGIILAAEQVLQRFPIDATDLASDGEGGGGTPAAPSDQASGGESGSLGGLASRWKEELGTLLGQRSGAIADAILSRSLVFLSGLTFVLFAALLMLIEAPRWREKLFSILPREDAAEWRDATEWTATSVRWFLVVKTILGAITGALYAGWMAAMGLDLVLVWGIGTFLVSYVPVIGSLVAGLAAAGYAFYQLSPGEAAAVALGLLAIEQVMGNYVEPRFLGRELALSSLAVLVSLVFWSWLWGPAGALLSTPILILALYVSLHVGRLRPLAVILSNTSAPKPHGSG